MLKESLRMENARQETVATQVGARVEGNDTTVATQSNIAETSPLPALCLPRHPRACLPTRLARPPSLAHGPPHDSPAHRW